jgi:hypothetical protein
VLDLLDHHAVTLLALECCGVILVGQPALRTSFDEKRVGDGGRPSRARASEGCFVETPATGPVVAGDEL